MHKTLKIIKTEHRRLAAIINCYMGVLRDVEKGSLEPDFVFLKSVHSYFHSFLYKFHHPKEDEFLFPALLKSAPELSAVIERLESEHAQGLVLLDQLDVTLVAFEKDPKAGSAAYIEVAENYRQFEWKHMALEEKDILPMAAKNIPEEEWSRLDAIFSNHQDPVFGDVAQEEYAGLLSHIVNKAPAPHGLGEA